MKECDECNTGILNVIDVDDVSLTVECSSCGEISTIEPDGLGEGGIEWAEAMANKEAGLL